MPERVTAISTGDFLQELEAAGRIQSADHILDEAAARGRNVEEQRQPTASDPARTVLREQLTRRATPPEQERNQTAPDKDLSARTAGSTTHPDAAFINY